jgi:energy-coupling factor transport system permease protein
VRALHPFTLIAIAVALPALAWILPAPWGGVGTVVMAAALLLLPGGGSTVQAARAALLTAAPFWFFLFLLHGPGGAVDTGLRLTTMIGSSVWLIAALPPPRLVEAMVARGWPVSVAFLLSSTLSAVPALRLRAARLVEAQRSRGLRTRGGPLIRLAALRALALPLVLSALHEVDERALALETRGLAPGIRRTPLAPPPDSPLQQLARWGVVLGCVAALVWRIV